MAASDKRATFLSKAKEAEEQAQNTADPDSKSSWLMLAKAYHRLTEGVQRRITNTSDKSWLHEPISGAEKVKC